MTQVAIVAATLDMVNLPGRSRWTDARAKCAVEGCRIRKRAEPSGSGDARTLLTSPSTPAGSPTATTWSWVETT